MKRLTISASLAFASAGLATTPAAAQAVVQPLPGTTDADRLADTMRRLAVSPTDLAALLDAGELSLKVDDLSGAASLFARADKVDPRSARAKAGMAAILVRAERPGEALRYYAQAEALGAAPARIAADRGLAYDLIGEQERAQRDYRLALKTATDEETVRRYALSLGISGRRDQALAVLDPLLRRSDRGAWRARAFVLAMTGDVAGASTIATTMMPSGMAQGLLPFFQRLPSLAAADRAFAVHFGEVRATPERLADARLTPTLAPLAPEPQAAIVLAAAGPPSTVSTLYDRRRDRRGQRDRSTVEVAANPSNTTSPSASTASRPVAAAPIVLANTIAPNGPVMAAPRPVQPIVQPASPTATLALAPAAAGASSQAGPAATGLSVPGSPPSPRPAATASAVPVSAASPVSTPAVATSSTPDRVNVPTPAPAPPRPSAPVVRSVAAASAAMTRPAQDSVLARIIANLSVPMADTGERPVRVSKATVSEARARSAADTITRRAAISKISAAEPVRHPVAEAAPDDEPADATPRRRRVGRSGRSVELADAAPASRSVGKHGAGQEADVVPDQPDAPRADRARSRKEGRSDDADTVSTRRRGRGDTDQDSATTARSRSARDKDETSDTSSGKRRGARERDDDRAITARRGTGKADTKAAERKAARAAPERIWVQVATGANEGDLPKAWSAVRGKAPDAFKGRSGYTAPLRATNRVVTGPFKTASEAQAFVNGLAKKGLSASTFTSDAGQTVSKLPASK